MFQRKNLIREFDVEKYDVILPLKFLFGRRRKAFLCSELEKRHPCFSDEFCFDVKFRALTKSGILTEVFVIHKRKLAEYEGKLSLSGTGFFIENLQKKKEMCNWTGRVFVSRRIKTITCSVVCGLTVLCFLSVITLIEGCATTSEVAENVVVEKGDVSGDAGAADTCLVAELCSIGKEFFDLIECSDIYGLSDGEERSDDERCDDSYRKVPHEFFIPHFEWRLDGFRECLSAELENIFPEALDNLKKDITRQESVSYVKGVPYMKVEYSQKVVNEIAGSQVMQSEAVQSRTAEASDGKLSRAVRAVLESDDAVLISEAFAPYTIDFQFSSQSSNSPFHLFENLNELFHRNEKAVSYVSVSSADGHEVNVKIRTDENLPIDLDISLLDGKQNFFTKSTPQTKPAQTLVLHSNHNSPQIEEEKDLKKIGEIRNSSGTSTVFYKNSAGKIIRKMEVL